MTYHALAFGLGHLPIPLAIHDDPVMMSLYYRQELINRLTIDLESLKLDFV
jgi:hypothetical protein